MKTYAGIGARKTPSSILIEFRIIASKLAKDGWILRSGAADGADSNFEAGCDMESGKKEIFLPWQGFNDHKSIYYNILPDAMNIASRYHPRWDTLKQGAKKLMARNAYQVLGNSLADPVDFIICWTENGESKGGTGQAIRHAKDINIPVYDRGGMSSLDLMYKIEQHK